MFGFGKNKISTESYKGVRDFFPKDQAVQNYIFNTMREVVESWGYEEYNASVLEPLDLYRSKSSEEIVNEQIYSFFDRGNREVALRPEMTPTVARMIAQKIHDLPPPIRWYSIPNLFRYEKPQRGRLREHWQLNVDIFGVKDLFADVEVINVASEIMKRFGAKNSDFEIRINSRNLLDEIFNRIQIEEDKKIFLYRIIDKKEKVSDDDFRKMVVELIGKDKAVSLFENLYYGEGLLTMMNDSESAKELNYVINSLRNRGLQNIVFSPTLTRGFDYYTGIVFEVFDTNKENKRSLFGGGRYDNLVGAFSKEDIPAFGFGMGDVTIKDFLSTHNLLPNIKSKTDVYICIPSGTNIIDVYTIANKLREDDINVAVDISGKKLSDQLKSLDKRTIPFVLTIGEEEIKNNKYTLRDSYNRKETVGDLDLVTRKIKEDYSK